MSLRWKREPGAPNPQMINQQMSGYQPLPNMNGYGSFMQAQANAQQMQGYTPNDATGGIPVIDAGRQTGGEVYNAQAEDNRFRVQQEISQLQSRLNEINTRIAEIDKTMPGVGSNDNAWEIAAQRASIGDMSAYDGMVQRGATGAQSANAIDNALMDAEKLTWGLNAKDDEDRRAARNQIEVALRKAERDAAQTGTKLPDSYFRLKKALEADVGGNASSLVNMLKYKKEKGTLTDDDRAYVEELMKGKENSKEYETLMSFWTESKGSTTGDKARAKAEKDAAYIDFKDVKDLGTNAAGQPKIFEVMQVWDDKRRKRFNKYYNVDPKTGKVTKK